MKDIGITQFDYGDHSRVFKTTTSVYVRDSFEEHVYTVYEPALGKDVEIKYTTAHTIEYSPEEWALVEQLESITPYTETKTAYIGDTEVTFYDTPQGNLTVYFPYAYTVERLSDRITISFDELEEVTDVTISIL